MTARRRNSGRRAAVPPLLVALGIGAGALVVILAGVSVFAIFHAIRLQHRLDSLPAVLQQAENDAENGQLAEAGKKLEAAQVSLGSVNSDLYDSVDFEIVNLLPVARQNLAAVRSAVSLGLQMVGDGEDILRVATPLESADGKLEVPLKAGVVPLSTTEAVQSAIAEVVASLPMTRQPPHRSFLIGRVRDSEGRIYAEAAKKRQQLLSVGNALSLIDDIAGADGNRRYLIAVANTAEMRGSGGMILSYGVMTSRSGKVTLQRFGGIDELALKRAETSATFPADFMKSYGDLAPTQNWREVNVMSDFRVDAPVMAAMYRQASGKSVDGVIQIDPEGLAGLLAAIGPVQTADLGTVTATNVVPLTLNQAYFIYPNRTQRQDYTGEAAQAGFAKLLSGYFSSLRSLGTNIFRAGREGHLLMYASDPTDETTIGSFGFSGALPAPTLPFVQLTIQNVGADKLDYYLQSSLTLTGQPPTEVGSHMSVTIELANTAPRGLSNPVEVFGATNPDEYQGLVTVYLPAGSALLSSQVDPTVTSDATESSQNGVGTITYTVTIPAGSKSAVSLNVFVPPTALGRIFFLPTPRVLPTQFVSKLH